MKRFIDLRHHSEDIGARFAWWCTVTDRFESYCTEYAWETWKDFEDVCHPDKLERYRKLCPNWVFEENREDV